MYFQHGSEYLHSFFADQVGNRVTSKFALILTNGFLGIVNLIGFLFPWIFIGFSQPKVLKEFVVKSSLQTKAIFGFVAVWVILIIAMAAAVFRFYDRYLLPVIPLFNLLLGYILILSTTNFKRTFLKIFIVLNLILLAINLWYTIFISVNPVLVAGILVSIFFVAGNFFGMFKKNSVETVLAGSIMLLYFGGFCLMYPLLMPNPGKQLVENLNKEGIFAKEKVYVYGNIRTASNIRIHSKNTFDVVSMDTVYSLPAEPAHFIVFSKKEEPKLNLSNYSVSQGSEEWKNIPVENFPSFLQKPVSKLKESGTKYFIGKPKN